ncbi:hypothetical protein R5H30_05290 [Sulfitobacter sp. D35]|uniref:hypothetical protein n=1 Tax=Sulfitobacter sp. D35 TaxID=3083252 RepID=UPI00296ED5DD|nr:hypothetical protein [Sulfitobacter sp. D35]MDW4497388.1 hypothetical protein [Sulfitobacter sp. D35]
MSPAFLADRLAACLLILLTGLVTVSEWGGPLATWMIPSVTLSVLLLLSLRVRPARLAFVAVGVLLTVLLAWRGQDWQANATKGLGSAAFIAAFFTALSTLRNVAETSPAIQAGGTFLALQPPGRRYAALTVGGHLFALLLNYGAISLLGGLASTSARAESDPEIRRHRTRRMLLAIQRGFIASLPWSPLAFAMAITTALIPGARWADAVVPGLVSAAIITVTGWALDTIFKPRLSHPPPARGPVEGSWALMLPLLGLLVLLGISVSLLHAVTGVRVVGIVMLVVPVIALAWALIQDRGSALDGALLRRLAGYIDRDLPGYRGEITLLMMAGYIGTVGAPLLAPLVAAAGLHPEDLPAWLVLAGFVWLLPVLGQLGMNPILAVTLIAPLIPEAAEMGVSPAAIVTALAAGWAVSGVSSPFTATTLLIGSFGGVSALHVGLRWNGAYVIVVATLLTIWVLAFAFLLS